MDLAQVAPGQGWLQTINNDFNAIQNDFSKNAESFDIVYQNGWTKDTGGSGNDWQSKIEKIPLVGSLSEYRLWIAAAKSVGANEGGILFSHPRDYLFNGNFIANVPVNYGGHFGGYIQLINVDNHVDYSWWPINASYELDATKPKTIQLETYLTWVA